MSRDEPPPAEHSLDKIDERLLEIQVLLQKEMPTLRDQFAMAALHVVIGLPSLRPADSISASDRAEMAYVYADAMLEARKAKP